MNIKRISPIALAVTMALTSACSNDSSSETGFENLNKVALTTGNYRKVVNESLSVGNASKKSKANTSEVKPNKSGANPKPGISARSTTEDEQSSKTIDSANNTFTEVFYGDCNDSGLVTNVATMLSDHSVDDVLEDRIQQDDFIMLNINKKFEKLTMGDSSECANAKYQEVDGEISTTMSGTWGVAKINFDIDVKGLRVNDLERGEVIVINGSMLLEESEENGVETTEYLLSNMSFKNESNNSVEILNNFQYKEVETDSQVELTFNGNIALSNQEYVKIETTEVLILEKSNIEINKYPSSGVVTWSGENESIVTMTVLSSDSVRLSVDENADGIEDDSEEVNWSDMTLPEFVNWL